MNTQSGRNVVVIKPQDLPLRCSGPNHETWNNHPRVFSPVQPSSEIRYPCYGTYYRLDGEVPRHRY